MLAGNLHGSAGELHNFHVGITEIRYAEDTQTYQVTMQLITHDLEDAVERTTGDTLKLATPSENPDAEELIYSYVAKHFSMQADGKTLTLKRVGIEHQRDEQSFLYFETEKMPPAGEITVTNTVLMELFSKQTQIINVFQNGETRSTTLSVKNTTDTLKL